MSWQDIEDEVEMVIWRKAGKTSVRTSGVDFINKADNDFQLRAFKNKNTFKIKIIVSDRKIVIASKFPTSFLFEKYKADFCETWYFQKEKLLKLKIL